MMHNYNQTFNKISQSWLNALYLLMIRSFLCRMAFWFSPVSMLLCLNNINIKGSSVESSSYSSIIAQLHLIKDVVIWLHMWIWTVSCRFKDNEIMDVCVCGSNTSLSWLLHTNTYTATRTNTSAWIFICMLYVVCAHLCLCGCTRLMALASDQ